MPKLLEYEMELGLVCVLFYFIVFHLNSISFCAYKIIGTKYKFRSNEPYSTMSHNVV